MIDRLNLATRTAGISIWDKDLVSGEFVSDVAWATATAPQITVWVGSRPLHLFIGVVMPAASKDYRRCLSASAMSVESGKPSARATR